jgi:hypothetical protein
MTDFREGAPAALLGLTLIESVIAPTETSDATAQMVVDTSKPTELLGIGISLGTYLVSKLAEVQGLSPAQVVANARDDLLFIQSN